MRPILITYLKDKDDRVVEYSLISLGQLKSKETLNEFFNDTYLAHKTTSVEKQRWVPLPLLRVSWMMKNERH